MKRSHSNEETQILRLARALLAIAKVAMPDTYYETDSRCRYARKMIRELTEPLEFCEFCGQQNSKSHNHKFCTECHRITEHCECAA